MTLNSKFFYVILCQYTFPLCWKKGEFTDERNSRFLRTKKEM